jgi:hypothetical protein
MLNFVLSVEVLARDRYRAQPMPPLDVWRDARRFGSHRSTKGLES